MSNYAGPSVAVKLFIDKEKQKVLFAESDKEFVDVLFSFLTLPLGAIVRILDKQSGVGCLDEVYKSVESLSAEHFHTEACKTMLLCPHNAAASHYDRLKVKVDCRNIRSIYVCLEPCYDRGFSSVSGSICKSCNSRRLMHLKLPQNDNASVGYNGDGAFVKSGPKLIITDDLQVAPASTGLVFSLLDKFGLNEKADIEEKFLHLDYDKDGGGYKCTCAHNDAMCATITLMNPKSPSGGNASNRAYIKGGLRNFIVTNDLRVLHFSLANTLQVMRSAMIPKEKLVEKDLALDKAQVLKLLSAATATREVLSSVLLPPKKKRHPHR
ncbi:unnamed protein product [Urochloa decumbens]|uniref:Uncharacterized protein n=1 Tax=Urochloa decumbens TaxID=240449 RepID=A0ABC9CTC5_9POAL